MEKEVWLRDMVIITPNVVSITWTEMFTFSSKSLRLAVVHSFLKMQEKAKGAYGQITSLLMGICILELVTLSLLKMQKEKNRSRQPKGL